MLEGWRQVRLGDALSQYVAPITVEPEQFYTNLGVQWYAGGTFQREKKRGRDMKATRLFTVRPRQFIYNRMFVTEGSFALVGDQHAGGVVSNEFPAFYVDETIVLPEYLILHFQQQTVWASVASKATGTTKSRRRWKEAQLVEYRMMCPSVPEQRRIVDLIRSVDDAIEASDAEAREADSLTERLRAVPLPGAPMQLGELLTSIDSGHSVATSNSESEGPKLLRISAIQRGRFKPSEFKRVGDATLPSRAQVRDGDVLMTRSNTPERVGFVGLADNVGDDCFMPDLIWRLVPNTQISPQYLVEILSSGYGRAELMARASGTSSSMKKISKARIKNILIPKPLPEDQERFVAPIMAAKQASDAARAHAEALRTLRSNLLTVLLSGEHEIPASYDQFLNLNEEAAS